MLAVKRLFTAQIPTQSFFTDDFGLPLTMDPNFEDLSCEMIFGQRAPPVEQDAVYGQPCFLSQCSVAKQRDSSIACPKIDTERSRVPARANALNASG